MRQTNGGVGEPVCVRDEVDAPAIKSQIVETDMFIHTSNIFEDVKTADDIRKTKKITSSFNRSNLYQ
jgi:hypothetical protein